MEPEYIYYDEELDIKLSEKLQQLSKEGKINLLKEMANE